MTAIVTRTPLHTLSMTGAQTNGTKRKSLRHATADQPDEDAPPAKKNKSQTAINTAKNASQSTVKTKSKRDYDEVDDDFNFTRTRSKKAKAKVPAVTEDTNITTAVAPPPETRPAQQQQPVQPTDESASKEAAPPPKKKPRKTLPTTPERDAPRRRSKRLSGNSPIAQAAPGAASANVPDQPVPKTQEKKRRVTPPPAIPEENAAPTDRRPPIDNGDLTVQKKRGPATIPLPFGETPVLRRNKEMRKLSAEKSRRSSSGMRGRRASSLIDSGSSHGAEDLDLNVEKEARYNEGLDFNNPEDPDIRQDDREDSAGGRSLDNRFLDDQADSEVAAVPHAQVETNEFYKHISQDLVEPKRMRQLLMWCGHRALPEKIGGGQMDAAETAAMHAARVIQEELLKEFGTRNNLSYWYDREDTAPQVALVKTPNPRNIQNAEKLQQLEAELARLQEEKRAWDALLSTAKKDEAAAQAPSEPMQLDLQPTSIDPTLLDPSQAETLQSLLSGISLSTNNDDTSSSTTNNNNDTLSQTQQQSTLTSTRQRITNISSGLEFKIDRLADSTHRVEQYRVGAHRLADRVLSLGAEKLEEREVKLKEKVEGGGGSSGGGRVDAMERLRGLSRLGRK